ncbi:MAG: HlyC/CorC family transporter [Deltaproteobacteria bacterium]|nr:HlyC/CorC family transporter [Deltaproteobacteria bacterium]
MDDFDYCLLEVGFAFLFLVLLTFFSLFESAFHRLTRFDLKLLDQQQKNEKNIVLSMLAHNDLAVMIPLNFGIQLSFIVVAVVTTHLMVMRVAVFPIGWALGSVFLINLLFRQLVPRIFTQINPERKLLFLLPAFSFIFPLLRLCAYPITRTVQRVGALRTLPEEEKSKEVVKREIQVLINIGEEENVLEKGEGDLVKSVLEFGDTRAREVMTPRSKIVAVSEGTSLREVQSAMIREKHSRIPVYRESLDQITGVVYVRHLLRKIEEGGDSGVVEDILLPPVFVPEARSLSELLQEMKRRRSTMVFVKNDYGGIAGLITIEDILEEIVGEISDEDQTEEEEDIVEKGEGQFMVSGNVSLDEVSEALDVSWDDEDCQTIGGLVAKMMGKLPRKGDCVELSGARVTVVSADRRKVNRLLVEKDVASPSEPEPLKEV